MRTHAGTRGRSNITPFPGHTDRVTPETLHKTVRRGRGPARSARPQRPAPHLEHPSRRPGIRVDPASLLLPRSCQVRCGAGPPAASGACPPLKRPSRRHTPSRARAPPASERGRPGRPRLAAAPPVTTAPLAMELVSLTGTPAALLRRISGKLRGSRAAPPLRARGSGAPKKARGEGGRPWAPSDAKLAGGRGLCGRAVQGLRRSP